MHTWSSTTIKSTRSSIQRSRPNGPSSTSTRTVSFTRNFNFATVLTSLRVSGGDVGGSRSHFHRSSMVCATDYVTRSTWHHAKYSEHSLFQAKPTGNKWAIRFCTDQWHLVARVLYLLHHLPTLRIHLGVLDRDHTWRARSLPFGFFLLAIPTAFSIASYVGFTGISRNRARQWWGEWRWMGFGRWIISGGPPGSVMKRPYRRRTWYPRKRNDFLAESGKQVGSRRAGDFGTNEEGMEQRSTCVKALCTSRNSEGVTTPSRTIFSQLRPVPRVTTRRSNPASQMCEGCRVEVEGLSKGSNEPNMVVVNRNEAKVVSRTFRGGE